jgi:AAA15 family ATPase/GTPase
MREEFPFLADINHELLAGAPTLYAKIRGKRVAQPLNLVSSGIYKIATILLHIFKAKGSFLCVDEVENGIFFDRLDSLWRLMANFAKRNKTQLFVTAHGLECIESAGRILDAEDLSLVQIFRRGNTSEVVTARGRDAVAAIHSGIEIRSR